MVGWLLPEVEQEGPARQEHGGATYILYINIPVWDQKMQTPGSGLAVLCAGEGVAAQARA